MTTMKFKDFFETTISKNGKTIQKHPFTITIEYNSDWHFIDKWFFNFFSSLKEKEVVINYDENEKWYFFSFSIEKEILNNKKNAIEYFKKVGAFQERESRLLKDAPRPSNETFLNFIKNPTIVGFLEKKVSLEEKNLYWINLDEYIY